MIYRIPGDPDPVRELTPAEREARDRERALARAIALHRRRACERAQELRVALVVGYLIAAIALAARCGVPGIFVAVAPVNLVCLFQLWCRSRAKLWKRLLWTPAILVPTFGPVVFGAFCDEG